MVTAETVLIMCAPARAFAPPNRLPRYDQFDDFQIEDMYHEIFLGTVANREQAEVYK